MRSRRARFVAFGLLAATVLMAFTGYLDAGDEAFFGTCLPEPAVSLYADPSRSLGAPQPFDYSYPTKK